MFRKNVVSSFRNYSRAASSQSVPVSLCISPAVSEEKYERSLLSAFLVAASIVIGTSLATAAYCDEESPRKAAELPLMVKKAASLEIPNKRSDQFIGIKLFTGNANKPLALDIANHLGMKLGKINVSHFADGEVNVMVNENVRGKDVYIIQPTSPPVNETLMELLLMISTMRRASARKITAVVPYYGYARQDRKMAARVPISAADVARLLEAMGVDRVVAVDLHCGQIQGFFGPRVPVDNLDGGTVGVSYFGDMDLVNPVVVSPDAGGVYRAKKFREALSKKHEVDSGLAMIIKQRSGANMIESMDLVGSVDGCDAIIVDDMVDTAGTLCKAAEVLKEFGARRVFAFCSHGVLSGPAAERISNSVLTELVVLDTVPLSEASRETGKITQLSVGPLLAQAIYNIHNKKSISALFK
jgi:ribose-phosphate pyrophosphokinase